MYAPAEHDEVTGLLHYLDQQLDALRASAFGLSEAQSRETPCRSSLSIAGLIKHAAYGMRGATDRLRGSAAVMSADRIAAYAASFVPAPHETTAALLAEFDAARAELLEAFGAADPEARAVEPPAPWHGRSDEKPDPAALLPNAPDPGDGPPRRPRGHHPRATRRYVDSLARADARGRTSE